MIKMVRLRARLLRAVERPWGAEARPRLRRRGRTKEAGQVALRIELELARPPHPDWKNFNDATSAAHAQLGGDFKPVIDFQKQPKRAKVVSGEANRIDLRNLGETREALSDLVGIPMLRREVNNKHKGQPSWDPEETVRGVLRLLKDKHRVIEGNWTMQKERVALSDRGAAQRSSIAPREEGRRSTGSSGSTERRAARK